MTVKSAIGVILAALAATGGTVDAQQPQPLPPGTWNVDWGDARCSLIRQSETSPPSYFTLQVVPGTFRSDLRIVSDDWPRRVLNRPGRLTISFQPQGWVIPGEVSVEDADAGEAVVIREVAEDVREAFGAAQSVRVARDGATVLEVPLPGSSEALTAFRECETTVMRQWGMDPAAHAALRTLPEGNLVSAFRWEDYPESARRARHQGTVVVRVRIGADGRPIECRTVVSSGHSSLDDVTCSSIMRRGRMTPAIGPDGQPTAADIVTQVTWRIPGAR